MKLIGKIGIGLGILAVGALSMQAVQEAPSDEIVEKKFSNDYNIYALPIPEYLEFAGEKVPLDDPDIRERFDRELLVNTYWQSNALLDRKSTRLNSSHVRISYAVFCLKKKKKNIT